MMMKKIVSLGLLSKCDVVFLFFYLFNCTLLYNIYVKLASFDHYKVQQGSSLLMHYYYYLQYFTKK